MLACSKSLIHLSAIIIIIIAVVTLNPIEFQISLQVMSVLLTGRVCLSYLSHLPASKYFPKSENTTQLKNLLNDFSEYRLADDKFKQVWGFSWTL